MVDVERKPPQTRHENAQENLTNINQTKTIQQQQIHTNHCKCLQQKGRQHLRFARKAANIPALGLQLSRTLDVSRRPQRWGPVASESSNMFQVISNDIHLLGYQHLSLDVPCISSYCITLFSRLILEFSRSNPFEPRENRPTSCSKDPGLRLRHQGHAGFGTFSFTMFGKNRRQKSGPKSSISSSAQTLLCNGLAAGPWSTRRPWR